MTPRILSMISAALCAAAHMGQASTLELWDTEKLAQKSSAIRQGKVMSRWSSYDTSKRMVYTYVKLLVEDTLKGEPASEVLLRIAGGVSRNLAMSVHGVAHFKVGEEALVFIELDPDGAPSVVGMGQGKYSIRTNKDGVRMADFRPRGAEYFQADPSHTTSQRLKSVDWTKVKRTLPLEELKKEIRRCVK